MKWGIFNSGKKRKYIYLKEENAESLEIGKVLKELEKRGKEMRI